MTEFVPCPLCEAQSQLFKSLGEHLLYRCASCENLFYSPAPSPKDDDESAWGSAKWYVERGANLLFYAEVLAVVREFVQNIAPGRNAGTIDMLEVGGSFGFLMDMASTLFGWNVTGVDPSPCAQQGSKELGLSVFNVGLEDAEFEERFDAIVGVQLIEHISEPRAFLAHMSHLVKEEGFVVLTTPNVSVEDLGAEYAPGEHHILFSRKGLSLILAGAGLIHHHFFGTSIPTLIGVVASKKPLPAANTFLKGNAVGASKQITMEYLAKRMQQDLSPAALKTGLQFRLFELLVNEGRYADADALAAPLERLMGRDEDETASSFAARLFDRMTSAYTPSEYVEAGPGCYAPYLFYQGILSLNYKKARAAADEFFSYAARLFEHEVQRLSLTQYEPWLTASKRHVEIAGRSPLPWRGATTEDMRGVMPKIEAAPFIRGGIRELCENVPLGRLLRLGARGGNSFLFTVRSLEDNLSGMSFDLLVKSYDKRESVEFTLHVFEEFNPVALRRTSQTIKFGSRDRLQRCKEPFRFTPIPGSGGKTYSMVLTLGKDATEAALLCTTMKGEVTVAGYTGHRNVRPVTIPYYYVAAPSGKTSRNGTLPLVSCLIVTYNSEAYIGHCLDSIARQDYPNIEVVVIDNCSSDHTVKIIREEFCGVNLFVMEKNLEFCRGNNFGVTKCRGEFICVLNADAVLEQGAISRFVEHMNISPHVAIVGATIETRGSRTRYADTFIVDGLISNDERLLEGTRFSSAPCGAGFMIRRSVIDDIGYLFDEGFVSDWEDHDLGLRCWLHGYVVVHRGELGMHHYGGGAYGLVDPRRESRVFRNMLLTYFKNFGLRLFVKAFLKTLKTCTSIYRVQGLLRFIGSFWKYLPERRALQGKRRIDDVGLQVVTSGFIAVIRGEKREEGS